VSGFFNFICWRTKKKDKFSGAYAVGFVGERGFDRKKEKKRPKTSLWESQKMRKKGKKGGQELEKGSND